MSQPSFLASGTDPLRTDTKSRIWTKILGRLQQRSGSAARNNPAVTDTLWRTKFKIARALAGNGCAIGNSGTGGGGGGGGGSGDPDVDAFLVCSGIAQGQSAIVTALLNLVTSLKNDGLWTMMDAIYPFVGGTPTSHACNLRNVGTYGITWHGGVTHDSNGITGDGSSGYGDTGYNPSTAAGHLTLNSASIGVYSSIGVAGAYMGCSATNGLYINFNNFGGGALQSLVNDGTGILIAGPTGTRSIVATRIASNSESIYYDSISQSGAVNSVALPNASVFVLANNISGAGNFYPGTLKFAFIGSGLSGGFQILTLLNVILTFQTGLGRV